MVDRAALIEEVKRIIDASKGMSRDEVAAAAINLIRSTTLEEAALKLEHHGFKSLSIVDTIRALKGKP
jgi:CBS-domain-containing membrane protein